MKRYSKVYTDYLMSSAWNERRQARLQKANYRCEKCGEEEGLEVHHKTYARLFNERIDDLQALCKSCHWDADNARKGNTQIKSKLYDPSQKSKSQFKKEIEERRRASKAHRKKYKEQRERKSGRGSADTSPTHN